MFETRRLNFLAIAALCASLPAGCGRPAGETPATTPAAEPAAPAPRAEPELEPAPEATPLPAGIAPLVAPFKGDLDGMVERRLIRVLTVQNPVLYFVDRGREVGITYEMVRAFEEFVNARPENKVVKVHVIAIPVPRDELLPRLVKGEGDIAAAALTVTTERQKIVDFGTPFSTDVHEVLVTGPSATGTFETLDDLAGKEVYVRPSSAYAEHLKVLNARFVKEGKAPVAIAPADEVLEDADILEMVNAGLVPATVVDSYIADIYVKVFPGLTKHADIQSPPMSIAWAFRKNSPKLAAAVDAFTKKHGEGTLAGNVLIGKYLKTTKWVKNARSDEDRRRFESMIGIFKKYSDKYEVDALLMVAQGYQESQLDQSRKSHVGAIGVMQVMPTTARDKAVNIPDISSLDNNIHAGIKYNRWVMDNFYNEPGINRANRMLFAFASYNAGPGRVAGLRREAKAAGLDPNKWFNNVELIAAKRIGRETVTYVSNIYKYYLAYQLMQQRSEDKAAAKKAAKG